MSTVPVVFNERDGLLPVWLAANILRVQLTETAVLNPVEILGVTYDIVATRSVGVPADAGNKVTFELHARGSTRVLRYSITVQHEETSVQLEPLRAMPLNT